LLTTRFAKRQIQPFSTVSNHFEFNSTAVTDIQFNLFNFKAFSKKSTIFNHCATKSRIPATSSSHWCNATLCWHVRVVLLKQAMLLLAATASSSAGTMVLQRQSDRKN